MLVSPIVKGGPESIKKGPTIVKNKIMQTGTRNILDARRARTNHDRVNGTNPSIRIAPAKQGYVNGRSAKNDVPKLGVELAVSNVILQRANEGSVKSEKVERER